MSRPRNEKGNKNLISEHLKELRKNSTSKISQRRLAQKLQLLGIDMDKNVITHIETNKRYVNNMGLQAIAKVFNVSYEFLIDVVD